MPCVCVCVCVSLECLLTGARRTSPAVVGVVFHLRRFIPFIR